MLEKREKLDKKEVFILISWLKGDILNKNLKFNYDELLIRCYSDNDEDVIISDHFDNLMLDLYNLYDKLTKITKEEIEDKIKENPMFNSLQKEWIEESMKSYEKFIKLYEKLILTTKFENENIKILQKNLMTNLITKYISFEEYEKCIDLKQKINEI